MTPRRGAGPDNDPLARDDPAARSLHSNRKEHSMSTANVTSPHDRNPLCRNRAASCAPQVSIDTRTRRSSMIQFFSARRYCPFGHPDKTNPAQERSLRILGVWCPNNHSTHRHDRAVGRLLLCAMALGLGVSTGWGQPAPDRTSLQDSLGPTWNDVCSLTVGNNDVHWAVGDSGKVLKTVNGDTSAGYVIGKGPYNLCGVSFADTNHGWIVGYKRDEPERWRGVVFRTTTGGDSPQEWTATFPVVRPGIDAPFLKVQAVSPQRVWLTYNGGYILRSNDGGVNWLVTAKRDGVEYGGKPGTRGHDHEK